MSSTPQDFGSNLSEEKTGSHIVKVDKNRTAPLVAENSSLRDDLASSNGRLVANHCSNEAHVKLLFYAAKVSTLENSLLQLREEQQKMQQENKQGTRYTYSYIV